MTDKKANKLIHSSSPYLLQHAHNPVNWYPWSGEAFDEAKERNVPVIVSIGYSSCHWCHVMEKESFENDEIADIMNNNFVNIKVDREERPDIDQIYMEAIQTMGLNGGWPLNVFITPDQKPFYGGTYFPPAQWKQVCLGVSNAYQNNYDQLIDSAEQFSTEISRSELSKYGIKVADREFNPQNLRKIGQVIKGKFDPQFGGFSRAPKFPMPNIWKFLLYANTLLEDDEVSQQVEKTLDEIYKGGIYDHIGGGFARYSVDEKWFAPHFEKMLYDNAQLIGLYAEAYKVYPKSHYKEVVYDSIEFLKREMMTKEGGFFSALDADSEGEEGKFYTWTTHKLNELITEDTDLFFEFFQIEENGNWENGRNILHLKHTEEEFAQVKNLDISELQSKIKKWKNQLLTQREARIRPGLDNKILAGWNGLLLKGLTDAYRTFGERSFLEVALKNGEFIVHSLMEGNELFRTKAKQSIKGYLEDYAFVIDGFIGLYQCTFDEKWLDNAKRLTNATLEKFFDKEEGMFFYSASDADKLIARKKEVFDNVIPGSNSQMAINLLHLSKYFYDDWHEEMSKSMLAKMTKLIETEPMYLTNWAILYFYFATDIAEVSIVGKEFHNLAKELDKSPVFNKIVSAKESDSSLPMLAERKMVNDQSTIYICYNKSCKLPVHTVKEALKQIKFEPQRA